MTDELFSLGVDIGGTFTDLVIRNEGGTRLARGKVLTTVDDPSQGVLTGITKILADNAIPASKVRRIVHGTTLVANALIERKGVPTALVTTKGFRDVLAIGRESRFDIYDLFMEMPEPLVPRHLRFELDERVDAGGRIVKPLDIAAVEALGERLKKLPVQSVAVVLLHAFRNDAHERAVGEVLARILPDVPISLSSAVIPEIGEYERSSTTVANSYVHPLVQTYLQRLSAAIARIGIPADLQLMLSDGGIVRHTTAAKFPIRLVQSGPAGGAQAAALVGRMTSADNVMCLDIGGTTAKVCLIVSGKPHRTTDFEVARVYRHKRGSGLPLRVPVVDMIEIGAGGGSISAVDERGVLQVGPESASSEPGPACYARGGTSPTVTDADVVLGYIDAEDFLGGEMKLDLSRARRAIEEHIAAPMNISIEEAAYGIFETANESMAQAARIHSIERGFLASDFVMMPVGGAGPVHAADIAARIGVKRIVSPPGAGVASAFGAVVSPISFSFVRSAASRLSEIKGDALRLWLDGLRGEAEVLLNESGVSRSEAEYTYFAAMRYVGQGHEVEAEVPVGVCVGDTQAALRRIFEEKYLGLYGHIEPDADVEILSWQLVASGPAPEFAKGETSPSASATPVPKRHRQVYFHSKGGFVSTPVYAREALSPGASFDGPALIVERETTLVVPPESAVSVDTYLNISIELAVSQLLQA